MTRFTEHADGPLRNVELRGRISYQPILIHAGKLALGVYRLVSQQLSFPSSLILASDDGPTCASGPLYSMLEEYDTLASLYYIGLNVLRFPREAQRAYQAGHEICAHTFSHSALTTVSFLL